MGCDGEKLGPNSSSERAFSDCTEAQLVALSSLRAPFECTATFPRTKIGPAVNILSAKSVFLPSARSYACVISQQEGGQVRLDITAATQMDLSVVAKWIGNSQIPEAVQKTIFHMAMHVVESEVVASGCAGDIVSVAESRKPAALNTAANKFFLVKLNIKSAALWSELSEHCLITVENSVTGQSIQIPVRVRIVGQAAKQVYKALDSTGFIDFVLIFLQHYSWIIPSLMWVCFTGIVAIAVYWFIRRSVWAREGTFNENHANRSSTSTTSVFSRASVSMQSSPSFFRSSPLGKSTPIFGESAFTSPKQQQRPIGAIGEPTLWSAGATLRK
uniref:Transmembrane protein n=1 Tax=Angiostrongylus cantonensis TaxID=6313 RepID=A0A0K0D4Q6_ANGCA